MEDPGILQYVFAAFPFLVLIYVLLVLAAQGMRPKTRIEPPKEKPSEGSGWLYLIEREGHIKVGKHAYAEGGVEGFVNRLKDYINPTSFPNTASVNVLYYQFYRGRDEFKIAQQETRMKHIIQGYAVSVTAGEQDPILSLNPNKDEASEYVIKDSKLLNPFTKIEYTMQEIETNKEVDMVRLTKELNAMHRNQDQMSKQVQEALAKIKEQKLDEVGEGELPKTQDVVINPYFLKVYRSNNAEWFKVVDANHDEEELKVLYELMTVLADKTELGREIVQESNQAIFEKPRIFLSKPPK